MCETPEVVKAPTMLTLAEVAPMLRKSVHTLRSSKTWIARLGAVKVGRDWLVRYEAVLEVLEGRR